LLAFVGVLPYDPFALLFTIAIEVAVCAITNVIFAKAFGVPANTDSVYISALILALIITPLQSTHDLWFLGWSAVLAMASKYILAINRKHLFNPAAFAVALTYLTINQSASWWVGDATMLPFVLIGGILIVRKIRRFDLVVSFLLAALATILGLSILNRAPIIATLQQTLIYSPLLFFAFVILTEPLTTPPARRSQIYYGMLVGVLFAPQFHIGSFYTTPELAILIGNLFAYVVSPKAAFMLRLKEKVQLAPDIYDFIFVPTRKFAFAPGQYMEWTLGHNQPDSRGNRRYFTLASSPTEDTLRLGVKFYQHSSSFKSALLAMDQQSEIVAAQVAGDFVLPNDPRQKCVFIAGGIGITPFRSMITYLLDTHQQRPIIMFYANKTASDIVYKDIFDRAQRELGIKTIYTITDKRQLLPTRNVQVGYLSPQLIKDEVPDYLDCTFYISGPPAMVDSFKAALRQIHVKNSQIKTDFFAGLA
ncbi:MAG: RnfABCDGE type electron transport complex subunit D, partial [Roseiflexaceae bacterium]